MDIQFGDRLKSSRKKKGLTQDVVADAAGVSRASVVQWEKGETKSAKSEYVLRAAQLLEVNPYWLVFGEGEMTSGPSKAESDYSLVPKYNISASMGDGRAVESEQVVDYLAFKKAWLSSMSLDADHLALIEVVGESMEPTLTSGSLVLIDLRKRSPTDSGIYAMGIDGQIWVKRLMRKFNGDLEIISDNSELHGKEIVKKDEIDQIRVIGRVVWVGKTL